MNSYELSRNWFNWSFDNPEKVKPIHSAIFFFALEHQNRLGGKEKFGFPSQMTMDAIGVKNYQTYGKALNQLSDWGFIEFIERSKNQYSANIISISATTKNGIARGKALDKAFIKHDVKQTRGTVSITKPINQETIINKKEILPIESNKYPEQVFLDNWAKCREYYLKQPTHINKLNTMESADLTRALKDFSKEEINTAMYGLFKQENITFGSMLLRPKHFLEKIDVYYAAEKSKDYKLYGTKKQTT